MSLDTYANLKLEIADWANDANLPEDTLLELVEADLNRKRRTYNQITTTTLSTTAQTIALPTDFIDHRFATVQTNPLSPLTYVQPGQIDVLHPAGTGTPTHFTIIGTNIKFGPSPDSAYNVQLGYYQKITPLDDTNTTNWVLTNHPDAYLFGARALAAVYTDPSVQNTETQTLVGIYNNAVTTIDENSKQLELSTPTQVSVNGTVI